jgi:cytochrome P450
VFSTGFVLGIPEEFNETIREWYDRFAAALLSFGANQGARARGLVAAEEFRRAMRPLLERARVEPTAGLFSGLVHAADRLDDDQILANALIILFGGIETTDSMMTNAIWSLLTHPDQMAAVAANPELRANAIEESLRWEPAVQSCTRFVTRDVEVGGVLLRAGQVVQCMLSGANRDPEHFPDPDRFAIRRPNAADHLAFGIGRHLCLGAHLARLETRVALDLALDGLARVRLDPDHPARPTGYEFRKPRTLVVKWDR